MKTLLLLVAVLTAGPAWAMTITFESPAPIAYWWGGSYLPPSAETSYWSGSYMLAPLQEAQWQSTWSNTTTFPSSDTALFNIAGSHYVGMQGPMSTVEGVWLAPWTAFDAWYDPYSAHTVTVEGWAGGVTLVGSTVLNLTPGGQYYALDFAAPVDQLKFLTPDNSQWYLLDNLTLTTTPEALERYLFESTRVYATPEPSTRMMLSVGLLLIITTALIIAHAEARPEPDDFIE